MFLTSMRVAQARLHMMVTRVSEISWIKADIVTWLILESVRKGLPKDEAIGMGTFVAIFANNLP